MDFEWTNEEQAARARLDDVFGDADGELLAVLDLAGLDDVAEFMQVAHERVAGVGYWVDDEGVWSDDGYMAALAKDAALADRSASLYLSLRSTRLFGGLVGAFGDDAQRGTWLGAIAEGNLIGAVAWSDPPEEPGAEEEPSAPMVAVKVEGGYRLTGEKRTVANALIADRIAVLATAGDECVIALVEPETLGPAFSDRLATLGLGGLVMADMRLDGVVVPEAEIIGPLPSAAVASWLANRHDFGLTVACVGVMRRAYRAAYEHARTTVRGGKKLIKRQAVAFELAEMFTLLQTAELLVQRTAWAIGAGEDEASMMLSAARVFTAEHAEGVAGKAVGIMASDGIRGANDAERAFRDAKALAVAGTARYLDLNAIGDELLRRHGVA